MSPTPIEHLVDSVLTAGPRAGELTLVGRGWPRADHFTGPEPGPMRTVELNAPAAASRAALGARWASPRATWTASGTRRTSTRYSTLGLANL